MLYTDAHLRKDASPRIMNLTEVIETKVEVILGEMGTGEAEHGKCFMSSRKDSQASVTGSGRLCTHHG